MDAELQGSAIITISVVFVVLSTAIVLLRIFTRAFIIEIVGSDDITIGIAQILAIATSVITVLEAVFGLGRHSWTVSTSSTIKQLKCLYANVLIYNAAQIVVKISLLQLYRRIFPSQAVQKLCLYLLIFIITWGITQEVVAGLACTPLTVIEPQMVGRCITTMPVWYLTSCMNIVTDFVIFAVPLKSVLGLQMRRKQKGLLVGLFCLGFFTCIISLIRLSTLHTSIHTTDPMWDNAPTAYWSIIELNCGILCASLPTLRPFVSRFLPSWLTSKIGGTYGGGGGAGGTYGNSSFAGRGMGRGERIMSTRATRGGGGDGRGGGMSGNGGIYIMKEVELRSTTELRKSAAYPERGERDSEEGLGGAGSVSGKSGDSMQLHQVDVHGPGAAV